MFHIIAHRNRWM